MVPSGNRAVGLMHRARSRPRDLHRLPMDGRPVIGSATPWSSSSTATSTSGARPGGQAGASSRRAPAARVPTISLSENLMKPTTMLYREPDGDGTSRNRSVLIPRRVVLLAGCDKTIAAQLLGAASAGVPAIMITGGPVQPAYFSRAQAGVGTDLWEYTAEFRAGQLSEEEYAELESALIPSFGHCNELGTGLDAGRGGGGARAVHTRQRGDPGRRCATSRGRRAHRAAGG